MGRKEVSKNALPSTSVIHEMEMTWKWLATGWISTWKWLASRKVLFASLLPDEVGLLLSHCHLVGKSDRLSQRVLSEEVIQVELRQEPPGIRTRNATACKGCCLIHLSECSTARRRPTVLIWEQMQSVTLLPLMGRQKKASHAEEYVLGTSKNNI